MARILVDESAAFRHRIPQVDNQYSDREAGDRKLGTVAKGLSLGEGIATSKALGALLAGGMRLYDAIAQDDPEAAEAGKAELRKKAAEAVSAVPTPAKVPSKLPEATGRYDASRPPAAALDVAEGSGRLTRRVEDERAERPLPVVPPPSRRPKTEMAMSVENAVKMAEANLRSARTVPELDAARADLEDATKKRDDWARESPSDWTEVPDAAAAAARAKEEARRAEGDADRSSMYGALADREMRESKARTARAVADAATASADKDAEALDANIRAGLRGDQLAKVEAFLKLEPVNEEMARRQRLLRDRLPEIEAAAMKADETAALQAEQERFAGITGGARPRRLTRGEAAMEREAADRETLLTGGVTPTGLSPDTIEKAKAFLAKEPANEKERLRQEAVRVRLGELLAPPAATTTAATSTTTPAAATTPTEVLRRDTPEKTVDLPFTRNPGKILAMASRASTQAERDHVMKLAEEANVYPSSLADLATGSYRRDWEKQVLRAFPKHDPLGELKAADIMSRIGKRSFDQGMGTRKQDFAEAESGRKQSNWQKEQEVKAAQWQDQLAMHKDRIGLAFSQMANARTMQQRQLAEAAKQKSIDAFETTLRGRKKAIQDKIGIVSAAPPSMPPEYDDVSLARAEKLAAAAKKGITPLLDGAGNIVFTRTGEVAEADPTKRKVDPDTIKAYDESLGRLRAGRNAFLKEQNNFYKRQDEAVKELSSYLPAPYASVFAADEAFSELTANGGKKLEALLRGAAEAERDVDDKIDRLPELRRR